MTHELIDSTSKASNDAATDDRTIRRSQLIQNTAQGSSANNAVFVEFHGLSYRIPEKSQDVRPWWRTFQTKKTKYQSSDVEKSELHYKTIIENIHGCANPSLMAIMGQSGSGKTTLLNILAGRVTKGVTGSITINGEKPTKNSKRFIAYCTQDDTFYPLLTVRESLTYTALLRLPRSMTKAEKLQQVENVIQLLHLTKCADTIIGSDHIRGISGGERKRVSIAAELLTDPSVILLDEPTSGLDSSLAFELVKILKEFTVKRGKTIIMVIHQPSSQVFEMFDKLLLMSDGKMVYFGDRADVVPYFAGVGYKCRENFNPADHILELLNEKESKERLIDAYASRVSDDPTGKQIVHRHSRLVENQDKAQIFKPIKVEHRWEATFKQQVLILTHRAFKQRRPVMLSRLHGIETIILTTISCLIWFRLSMDETSINDRRGLIFFSCIFWSFTPLITAVTSFPLDRSLLNKERQSRSYRLSSYFIAKQIAEFPLVLVAPLFYTLLVYWIGNLVDDFGRFVAHMAITMITVLTAQGFGYFFGAVLMDMQQSMTASTVFMLSTMLLAGFYATNIPYWIEWTSYISFSRYSFRLLMQNQFLAGSFRLECVSGIRSELAQCANGADFVSGEEVLEHLKLNDTKWYINLISVFAYFVGIRLLAYFALRNYGKKKTR
ncbi:9046_t:CDS:2 [Paraglomus occultum]|uniref:9046_t:CDS:1 n=1 Tax=Paraglomus occultum TaxID=144539 RepID=A0A9N9AHS3_9GLOM|nr:9046_t:CDS:2 [Paraglomus occultum]